MAIPFKRFFARLPATMEVNLLRCLRYWARSLYTLSIPIAPSGAAPTKSKTRSFNASSRKDALWTTNPPKLFKEFRAGSTVPPRKAIGYASSFVLFFAVRFDIASESSFCLQNPFCFFKIGIAFLQQLCYHNFRRQMVFMGL